jgi:hypothetical protein
MIEDPKLAPAEVIAPTIDFQAYLFPDETQAEYVDFRRPCLMASSLEKKRKRVLNW